MGRISSFPSINIARNENIGIQTAQGCIKIEVKTENRPGRLLMVRHVFNRLEAGSLPQRSNGKGFCNRIHVSDIPGSIRGNNAIAYAVQRDSQVLLFLGQQGYCIRLCLLRDFQTFLRYGQNIFGSGQLLLGFHQLTAELPRRYPLPTHQNRIDFLKIERAGMHLFRSSVLPAGPTVLSASTSFLTPSLMAESLTAQLSTFPR